MKIRMACIEDLEQLIKIEQCCFPVLEAASEKSMHQRFDYFSDCFIVATIENQVVGFINGCATTSIVLADELYHDASLHQPAGDYQTVFGLDVWPEYRHQGIATKLLMKFIDLAKQRGKKGMILTCKNHLLHYYERFGFVSQGISDSSHGGSRWNDMLLIFEENNV